MKRRTPGGNSARKKENRERNRKRLEKTLKELLAKQPVRSSRGLPYRRIVE